MGPISQGFTSEYPDFTQKFLYLFSPVSNEAQDGGYWLVTFLSLCLEGVVQCHLCLLCP
jgi:hypothetical protein